MGCDIHTVWQKSDEEGKWVDIPQQWDEPRFYALFALLAGVRDYRYPTTIKKRDGLPEDFEVDNEVYYKPTDPSYLSAWNDVDEKWLGDHSHTWYLLSELLEWYDENKSDPEVVELFEWFFSLCESVQMEHGNVRLIMGFDN